MTEDGFRIGVDLTAHSQQLSGVMDALQQAMDAARQVSMPTDAYGILCQPFRMMLDPVEKYGMDALKDAVEAMDAASNEIKSTAQTYQGVDQGHAATFKEA
jgi:uncharacterized protein YukE